jgi:hypothetical protein
MADVQKRVNKSGEVRWDVRYRDDARQQRKRSFERKLDAQRFARAVETDMLRGDWIDPRRGQETFAVWAEAWLETIGNRKPVNLKVPSIRWWGEWRLWCARVCERRVADVSSGARARCRAAGNRARGAGQAAQRYSLISVPHVERCVTLIGTAGGACGTVSAGARWSSERCGRCSL